MTAEGHCNIVWGGDFKDTFRFQTNNASFSFDATFRFADYNCFQKENNYATRLETMLMPKGERWFFSYARLYISITNKNPMLLYFIITSNFKDFTSEYSQVSPETVTLKTRKMFCITPLIESVFQ